MTRTPKAFGLALIAVLAMSAVTASTAQALPQFTADEYTTHLIGTPVAGEEFTINLAEGGKITCNKTLTGTLAKPSSTLTYTPTFEECEGHSGAATVPVTITMGGCDNLLHMTKKLGPDQYTADVDFVCPEGKDIEIHVYPEGTTPAEHKEENETCRYTIKPQNNLATVEIINDTKAVPKKDFTMKTKVTGIEYTRVLGDARSCGPIGGAASFGGSTTVKGRNTAGEAVGIEVTGE